MSLSGFDPIIADDPRLVILGSMPSVTSLAKQEYYGYRHNRFWRIMEAYFHIPLNDYQAKRRCIQDHHIILWDVIASCEREGSLDSAIRHVVCNDVATLIHKYPSIRLILCNGKKSYELYQKHMQAQIAVECVCLPSTSNANRTIQQEALFEQWFYQLDRVLANER